MSGRRKVMDEAFLTSLETLDLYIHNTMSGRFGGIRRSFGAGGSCEFLDYREYAPGDDLRSIDWNLYGRLEKYYIKRYVDERQQETHIYLDISRSMDSDATGKKAVTALQTAAALGYLSVQNMDRVAFRLLQDGRCRDLCGSVMGREGLYHAAEQLETVVFSGEDCIDKGIRADPLPGYDDGLSVLVSDFLTDSNWKGAVDYLLSRKREVALIQVLCREEINPFYVGPSTLADSEALDEGDPRNLNLRIDRIALRLYAQVAAEFEREIHAFCASRRVACVTVWSDQPVAYTLIRQGLTAELLR